MGNTGSQEEDPETQKYKEYIKQQQDIIEAQQRQLNQQRQMNQQQINQQQQTFQRQQHTMRQPQTNGMPSNVYFEQQGNYNKAKVLEKTEDIYKMTSDVINLAFVNQITTHQAALNIATKRIEDFSRVKSPTFK